MDEVIARIALLSVDGVGPRRCQRLLETFGSAIATLHTPYAELIGVEDIGETTARAIVSSSSQRDEAEKIFAACERDGNRHSDARIARLS